MNKDVIIIVLNNSNVLLYYNTWIFIFQRNADTDGIPAAQEINVFRVLKF